MFSVLFYMQNLAFCMKYDNCILLDIAVNNFIIDHLMIQ